MGTKIKQEREKGLSLVEDITKFEPEFEENKCSTDEEGVIIVIL